MNIGQLSREPVLNQGFALVLSVLLCLGAASLGAAFTGVSVGDWYLALQKPSWNPPAWVFGPVWTFLYLTMAVAAWLVWRQRDVVDVRLPLILFGIQLVLNSAWSALFFALRSPGLAFAEMLLLWAAILATILTFRHVSTLAAALMAPYLAWVSFAAFLNATIWRMNA